MSNRLRISTCLLALVLAYLAVPTDGAAQRSQGANPADRVTALKAAGVSAHDIAGELQRTDRLDADGVRKLLAEAGFDSPTVEAAVEGVFGRTSSSSTVAGPPGRASGGTGTATGRGTMRPVTRSGGPTRVGPAPPKLSVQLRSFQSGAATLDINSSDDPTAMRFANNLEGIRTAPWQAYEPTATFSLNGLFPAQVVVQVGKPVGFASHPVNGPHVESDPQVVRDPALMQIEDHLLLIWTGRPFVGVPGKMLLRLTGLGDVRQIRVDNLEVCNPGSGGSPFGPANGASAPIQEVTQDTPDVFSIRLEGRFSRPTSGCVASFLLLGDGGNFDPGVQYSVRMEDASFSIGRMPRHRTEKTSSFEYRPDLQRGFDFAPGECQKSSEDGRLVIEAASGIVPLICEFWSPAVLLPETLTVTALSWRLDRIPAEGGSGFHCRLGIPTRVVPGYHFEGVRGSELISHTRTDYFYTTVDANPLLPGDILPDVLGDLSTAKERNWILPLRAVLSCDPRQDFDGGLVGDRIRLTLNHILYEAPSALQSGN